MADTLLEVGSIYAGYGEGLVLEDVSFALKAGESLAVLGRNGVGKSTLLLTLMGHLGVRAGAVLFADDDVTTWQPFRRVKAGLGWVPQEREIFPSLTVAEHLDIAARKGYWNVARVCELFPRLAERRKNYGNQLSGGEQQMLAIARALMTNPKLLLLDEPLEGLAPVVAQEVARCVQRLASDSGMAIMLIEQDALFALELTQDTIVLDRGCVVHRGSSSALLSDHDLLDELVGLRCLKDPAE